MASTLKEVQQTTSGWWHAGDKVLQSVLACNMTATMGAYPYVQQAAAAQRAWRQAGGPASASACHCSLTSGRGTTKKSTSSCTSAIATIGGVGAIQARLGPCLPQLGLLGACRHGGRARW